MTFWEFYYWYVGAFFAGLILFGADMAANSFIIPLAIALCYIYKERYSE